MHVCTYVYTCMHTYIHTYIHTYMHLAVAKEGRAKDLNHELRHHNDSPQQQVSHEPIRFRYLENISIHY